MKYPLSIFNFDTLQPRVKQIILQPAFLGTLLLLICIEIALHFVIPSSHVPTGSWKNAELRDQAMQLEDMDHVNLMFTGSSIAAVNIPPKEFDAFFKQNGVELSSFNGGIRGCNYTCIKVGFQHMFLTRKKPEYVVLVVGPGDLNQTNTFMINRSQQFIKNFSIPTYAAVVIDSLSHSWLFGFRNEIREFIKTRKWIYEESRVADQGYINLGNELNPRYKLNLDIQPDGPITTALMELTSELLEKGIKVIILPGLMDSETRSQIDDKSWKSYGIILDRLKKIPDVTVLDTSHLTPADNKFVDRVHLNTRGAIEYTGNLAKYMFEKGYPW